MGAPSKRARKVRDASEFDTTRASTEAQSPRVSPSAYSWDLAAIVNARDAQMSGRFRLAARLAESMRTDDALFVAYSNRLAALRCIKAEIKPARGRAGAAIAAEAEALFGQDGVGLHPDTLRDVQGCLVNHGVAFANVVATPRDDGSRVDYALKFWPIEFVRWDAYAKAFKTQVQDEFEEAITHGDGRWVIFQEGECEPFKNGALLAAAMVWARHAFAIRDWAKGSVAHGSAKVIGEMPEGVALQRDGAGGAELTPEAAAMVSLLRSIASADAPVGIRPAGSKIDFLTNSSTAWQVWTELVANAEKAAARIYLGTDGTLGTNGGAPGVDISALFGVSTTKVQGDLAAIERGVQTGLIEVWCAVNFGDSSLAPTRKYLLPDVDADAARASLEVRTAAFYNEIDRVRAGGFIVDQPLVDAVAERHGVDAPQLPAEAAKAPSIALAPTDIARVVTVNEARAGSGLGALLGTDGAPSPDGALTLERFAAPAPSTVAPASTPVSPPALALVAPSKPGAEVDHAAASREILRAHANGTMALLERIETFSRRVDGLDALTAELQTLRDSVASGAEMSAAATEQSEERMTATLAELAAIRAAAAAPPAVVELSFAERNAAYMNDLKDHRGAGLLCDQKRANELADLHGVPRGKVAK